MALFSVGFPKRKLGFSFSLAAAHKFYPVSLTMMKVPGVFLFMTSLFGRQNSDGQTRRKFLFGGTSCDGCSNSHRLVGRHVCNQQRGLRKESGTATTARKSINTHTHSLDTSRAVGGQREREREGQCPQDDISADCITAQWDRTDS